MQKVLVVAYYFPPIGGSGVQRTAKFAKYLPTYGWQPLILTVDTPRLRETDHSLLRELPDDLPVYRTRDMNLPYLLRTNARRLISMNNRHSTQTKTGSSRSQASAKGRLRKVFSAFADTWLQIPDPFVYWLPGAVRVGLKLVKQCDVIYSTASPFTDHLVAYILHKLSGKPWVADYRDPWTQYVFFQRSSSRLRSRVDAYFERLLLNSPDLVLVTCAATARSFQDAHPDLPKEKFIEITNGFDAEDFEGSDGAGFDRFTVGYTGRFYDKKNASSPFLQAVRDLRWQYPDLASEIQIVFAGIFGEHYKALLTEWHIEDIVKPLGYVSHQESTRLLLQSDVLLLTLNDEPGVNLTYPGKLFEYLAARKTILALVPEGATADLIRDMEAGPVVPPDDVEAIKEAILNLHSLYKQGCTLSKTYHDLGRFERRMLTRRLATCLDALVEKRSVML